MRPSGYWWFGTDGVSDDLERIAADLRHRAASGEGEPIGPLHVEREIACRTSSMLKCSSKSRMNGPIAQDALLSFALPSSSALRPSKSRRLTSLPSVAPTTRPRVADGQHDFGFRIVPLRLRVDADFRAGADCGHRLTLREDLGVRSDANLQVLGPHALLDQHVLEPARFVRAGTYLLQVGADDGSDRRPQALGLPGVASRLLFDDALEEARHKRDAARLDGLEVARREEPRHVALPRVRAGVRQHFNERRASCGSGPARRIAATGSSRFSS